LSYIGSWGKYRNRTEPKL